MKLKLKRPHLHQNDCHAFIAAQLLPLAIAHFWVVQAVRFEDVEQRQLAGTQLPREILMTRECSTCNFTTNEQMRESNV
jgi:hypothetical protein